MVSLIFGDLGLGHVFVECEIEDVLTFRQFLECLLNHHPVRGDQQPRERARKRAERQDAPPAPPDTGLTMFRDRDHAVRSGPSGARSRSTNTFKEKEAMNARIHKRVVAASTALALALTLSACAGDDDDNGTNGDTDENGVTTTVGDDLTTTTSDLTTTTEDTGTATTAP